MGSMGVLMKYPRGLMRYLWGAIGVPSQCLWGASEYPQGCNCQGTHGSIEGTHEIPEGANRVRVSNT